jgi:ABC-type dipeptide/oligopeptide/nickel transport system permease subunit
VSSLDVSHVVTVRVDDGAKLAKHQNQWRQLATSFLSNRSATTGGVIVLALSVVAILAPSLAPHPYAEQSLFNSLMNPLTANYPLGTDQFGRDVLSRIIWGARVSMEVGLIVTSISMMIGLTIGCLAGYYGGTVDLVLSNLIDLVWGFPLILVALLIVTVKGPGLSGAMIATGLVAWSGFARIVRGEVMSIREWGFVGAAEAVGASDARIILRHILPNMLGPVLVMATFTMAAAVIIEASLSFLGLGVQPPQPSWGSMLNDGRSVIYRAYWMAVFPGIAIAILVLGFNLLGDGLRDVLDPRMRRR